VSKVFSLLRIRNQIPGQVQKQVQVLSNHNQQRVQEIRIHRSSTC